MWVFRWYLGINHSCFLCNTFQYIYSKTWILHSCNVSIFWFYAFLLVLPELAEELSHIFLEYVPSNQFLNYMFNMIINWPVAVILSNFDWKPGGKKFIFSYNLLLPLCCLHLCLFFQGIKFTPSEYSHSFLPMLSVCNNKWLGECN